MAEHDIVAAGKFTVTLIHPLWNGGVPTTINGFRQDGQMIQAQQLMPNSKIVALANGGTIIITNVNNAGKITFNMTKTGQDGDMVKIANYLKKVGDSIGGTIRVTQEVNGKTDGYTFAPCTVEQCPPLSIMGNDAANYSVTWNYGDVTYD